MARIFAAFSGRAGAALVIVAAALPRLVVLLAERGNILTAYTEKSDYIARIFASTGTFGFAPGVPSADTQPLYALFLAPLYWIFGRHWAVVGIAQIAVAVATALIVFAIAKRVTPAIPAVPAIVATLNPYLIWHDVHVNREIVDQLALAGLVLVLLIAAERRSAWWAAGAGAVAGIAVLGNSRLAALPFVVAAWLVWRLPRGRVLAAAALLLACVAVVSPWVIRNRVQVGCATLTTDGRALWKANNVNTYLVLAHGGWIDDVPPLPGAPTITAQYEWDYWRNDHRIVRVDECAQMRVFEHAAIRFWKKHPGEKAKLMGQATELLWDPRGHETQGRSGSGTWRDQARRIGEPAFMIPLYVLAIAGLFFAPGAFTVLAVLLLAYNTVAAMVFAGTTRYRVPFDFLLALLAGAAIERLLKRSRYTASTPSTADAAEK